MSILNLFLFIVFVFVGESYGATAVVVNPGDPHHSYVRLKPVTKQVVESISERMTDTLEPTLQARLSQAQRVFLTRMSVKRGIPYYAKQALVGFEGGDTLGYHITLNDGIDERTPAFREFNRGLGGHYYLAIRPEARVMNNYVALIVDVAFQAGVADAEQQRIKRLFEEIIHLPAHISVAQIAQIPRVGIHTPYSVDGVVWGILHKACNRDVLRFCVEDNHAQPLVTFAETLLNFLSEVLQDSVITYPAGDFTRSVVDNMRRGALKESRESVVAEYRAAKSQELPGVYRHYMDQLSLDLSGGDIDRHPRVKQRRREFDALLGQIQQDLPLQRFVDMTTGDWRLLTQRIRTHQSLIDLIPSSTTRTTFVEEVDINGKLYLPSSDHIGEVIAGVPIGNLQIERDRAQAVVNISHRIHPLITAAVKLSSTQGNHDLERIVRRFYEKPVLSFLTQDEVHAALRALSTSVPAQGLPIEMAGIEKRRI